MASKRFDLMNEEEQRAAACDGKASYPNANAAASAHRGMYRKSTQRERVNTYRCRFCGQWHIGHNGR